MRRKERRAAAPGSSSVPTHAAAPVPEVETLFATALAQHRAGQLAAAETAYRHILTIAPRHARTLHFLGVLHHQTGRSDVAVELMEHAIAVEGDVADFHYNFGVVLEAMGRLEDAAEHHRRTTSLNPNHANAHLNLSNVLLAQNKLDDAEAASRRAIALAPHSPHPRYNLGLALVRQRRCHDAITQFVEVVHMVPGHAAAHAHLGSAYAGVGDLERAIHHCRRSLTLDRRNDLAAVTLGEAYLARGELKQAIDFALYAFAICDSAHARDLFCRAAPHAYITAEAPQFRSLLVRALRERWLRPGLVMQPAVSMIKLNSGIRAVIERLELASESAEDVAQCGDSEIVAIAKDPLLRELLRVTPVCNGELERVLATLRRYILNRAVDDTTVTLSEDALTFFCALAQQCFHNEYIYSLENGEQARAEKLGERVAAAIASDRDPPPLWLAAVATYMPLHSLPCAELLVRRTWPAPVAEVVRQQIVEPKAQQALRTGLPRLTTIDDATSIEVKRQYEQNPYPRWTVAATAASQESLDAYITAKFPRIPYRPLAKPRLDILNAGCGTGRHAIETALRFTGADVLAIDLSTSSLAYALFKSQQLGLANIRYAVADILKVADLGRTFDVIEAQGVLHHLADPMAAWRLLLSILRPGGLMSLGLYSALARQPIAYARAFITERGYQASADGIRRCRQEMAHSGDPLLKAAMERIDFFTISECRDLLFHVREHCLTLPQIATFIEEENLTFLGFDAEAVLFKQYAVRFPGDQLQTDLTSWHQFETENPRTFAAMYRFWVQKPSPLG